MPNACECFMWCRDSTQPCFRQVICHGIPDCRPIEAARGMFPTWMNSPLGCPVSGGRCREPGCEHLSSRRLRCCEIFCFSKSKYCKLNHFNKWKRYDVANILRMISVLDPWIWHVYDRFKFMQIYAYPFWLIHAIPGSKWKSKLRGFHSDLNETFFIGECDEDSQRLVRTWTRKFRKIANSDVPRFMLCMCSLILEIDSLWLYDFPTICSAWMLEDGLFVSFIDPKAIYKNP